MDDIRGILEGLDFNAVNSGDPLARIYFGKAASAIRKLEADRDHYQHMSVIDRLTSSALRRQLRKTEKMVADLEASIPIPPAQHHEGQAQKDDDIALHRRCGRARRASPMG